MTQTRSRRIADTRPQASRRDVTARTAKAAQRSIDRPNLATEHAKGSNSTSTATIADAASTTKDHTANNPLPSATKDPAPSDPAPTNSTTSAAFTYEVDSIAEQDALPSVSTQPVNTAANDFAPTTSAIADAVKKTTAASPATNAETS